MLNTEKQVRKKRGEGKELVNDSYHPAIDKGGISWIIKAVNWISRKEVKVGTGNSTLIILTLEKKISRSLRHIRASR